MILLLIFVISTASCLQNRNNKSNCSSSEVSCDDGQCIFRLRWCDAVIDCSDGSDERKGCTPLQDEIQADSPLFGNWAQTKPLPGVGRETIARAAKYIVSQATDDGWGDFTPRAVVALSFAHRVSPLSSDEENLMMKHLKVHLMRDLLAKTFHRTNIHGTNINLISLASYVNALYATCQDPRSFQGRDLVSLLRSEVNAVKSDFSYPYVLLSLCLADSVEREDVYRLTKMYNESSIRPGFKALVITAMSCIVQRRQDISGGEGYVKDFFNKSSDTADKLDIYSKTLYLQAAIASKFSTRRDIADYQLERLQLSDGSFGDMLATYSAIPVLLYSSLLDLRCELPAKEATTNEELKDGVNHRVVYSLWIPSEQGIDTRSTIVPFSQSETFLDIMKTAASRNPLYNFLYEETASGKKVYSLAGIDNEYETARKWTLFEGHPNVSIDAHKYLKEITVGVDRIFPTDEKHYSFWFFRADK